MVKLLVSSRATKNRLVHIPMYLACVYFYYKYHEVRSESNHCSQKGHDCQSLRVPYRFAWFVIVYMAWFSVSCFANPPLGLHDFVQIHANSTFWMITRRLLIMYMNANLKGHDMYNGYKL